MARSLKESGLRLRRLPGTAMFYRGKEKQYQEDIQLQHQIADEVRPSLSVLLSLFSGLTVLPILSCCVGRAKPDPTSYGS
jgi:hypothetical protein